MLLAKRLLEVIQHQLELLNISHTKLGHMLLELFFLKINFVFEFDDLFSQSHLRSNGTLECDTDANRKLMIIKTEIWVVKPFINEVIQYGYVEEGQIIEDLYLLLALYQLFKSILTKLVIRR